MPGRRSGCQHDDHRRHGHRARPSSTSTRRRRRTLSGTRRRVCGVAGLEHRGDLAVGAAGAGGLERQHASRGRRSSRRRRRSAPTGPWRWRVSITAASAAETSGRSLRTSGSSSRTCFIATADLGLGLERELAGEHLVEHDAERVEVGLAGDGLAQRLLGGRRSRSCRARGRRRSGPPPRACARSRSRSPWRCPRRRSGRSAASRRGGRCGARGRRRARGRSRSQ